MNDIVRELFAQASLQTLRGSKSVSEGHKDQRDVIIVNFFYGNDCDEQKPHENTIMTVPACTSQICHRQQNYARIMTMPDQLAWVILTKEMSSYKTLFI